MSKVTSLENAVKLIQDGDTITWSGSVGVLTPEGVLGALEARFLSEGHPCDLTCFEPCPSGIGPDVEHFAHEGFVKRIIVSILGQNMNPWYCQQVVDGKLEAFVIPLGLADQLPVEIAKKSPGFLTKVGLYSYLDPRVQGGKYNTTDELIKLVEFEGEEWLLYKSFPVNVAIIRGTTADEDGNLSLEEEPLTQSVLHQAMAAKNWGGKVIAQVKRVVPKDSLDPRMVLVPGVMVDAIVVVEDQWQHERFPGQYDPGLDGRKRVPPPPAPFDALDTHKVIARRAAMELRVGEVANWGGGLPTIRLAPLTLEEDIQDLFVVSREHGTLGGISYGRDIHINPTSWLSYEDLFNWYRGGGLDLGVLGFAEVDEECNMNLTWFGGTDFRGPGGAPDIAHYSKRMVYTGTFTYGGLRIDAGEGKMSIANEGRNKKFVKRVRHITISGKYIRDHQQQPMLFVTERAVLQFGKEGFELVEIAPGIDLEKDVLGQMEFKPLVSNSLRTMDERIFKESNMGLRRDMLGYEEKGRKPPVTMVPAKELPAAAYWTARASRR